MYNKKVLINFTKITLLSVILSGCSFISSEPDDLKDWVEKRSSSIKSRVNPLPRTKEYVPVVFEGVPTIDPFKLKEINAIVDAKEEKQTLSPEINRRKEPLESYPLTDLELLGFISQDKEVFAIIRARDGKVFNAKKGNYLGNNFGKIIKMDDSKLEIRELLVVNEEWSENITELSMRE